MKMLCIFGGSEFGRFAGRGSVRASSDLGNLMKVGNIK